MKVTPSLDTTTIAKKTFNYIGITASIITIVSFAPDIYSYIFEMYLPLNQESQTEQRLQTEPEAPTEPSSPLVWPHYVTDQTVRHLVKIYQAETKPVSFYCGCDIFFKNNEPKPDLQSCGYTARRQLNRAKRVEWEHIVPAWEYGHERQCWQEGDRWNCNVTDAVFRVFENDIHNLVPVVGEVNSDRSNYRFGLLDPSTSAQYGKCPMKIDFKQRVAEPPENSRGAIARAYFYMSDKYGLTLKKEQRNLFNAWNEQHPPTDKECRINKKVAEIQGGMNPYISEHCQELQKSQ